MAGRSSYSDADKARVYVVLKANEDNVKRTARDTGVPENTVRRWRDEWKKNGPPNLEEVETAVQDFVETAERVRNLALLEIERQIKAQEMKGAALVTAMGVLDDKIARARGINPKVEHEHKLPSAQEVAALLTAAMGGALEATRRREEEIIDAEVIEQPALPPGR